MADAKTPWGTDVGTASASIDIVLMEAPRPLSSQEILAEVRRRNLPARQEASPHLSTLKRKGFITNCDGKWFKVSPADGPGASIRPSAPIAPSPAIASAPTLERPAEPSTASPESVRRVARPPGAPVRAQVELCIDFGQPVRLSELRTHRKALCVHGIYLITEGRPKVIDPVAQEVVYIGKAIKQTVYGRCVRHIQSVKDARSKTGRPLSGPGHSFKRYRDRIDRDPSRLWVTPGVMCVDIPYAISCAEEYLLHEYRLVHGRYPWCNSAGQEKQV